MITLRRLPRRDGVLPVSLPLRWWRCRPDRGLLLDRPDLSARPLAGSRRGGRRVRLGVATAPGGRDGRRPRDDRSCSSYSSTIARPPQRPRERTRCLRHVRAVRAESAERTAMSHPTASLERRPPARHAGDPTVLRQVSRAASASCATGSSSPTGTCHATSPSSRRAAT